jgi:hypothetical protein
MESSNIQNLEEAFQHCSFCKISKADTINLIAGKEACICPNCALGIHQLLLQRTDIQTVNKARFSPGIYKSMTSVTAVLIILLVLMVCLYFAFH